MNPTNSPVNRAIDMRWLRRGLAAIAFLLMLITVELSALIGPLQPRAQAQIPDSGASSTSSSTAESSSSTRWSRSSISSAPARLR